MIWSRWTVRLTSLMRRVRGQIVVIKETGHFSYLERPAELRDVIVTGVRPIGQGT